MINKLFACVILLAVPFAVSADPLVFKKEFVVYADGPFCPYADGIRDCPVVYPAGVHLFTEKKDRELVKYDRAMEKKYCSKIGAGRCAANFLVKKAESFGANDPQSPKQWHHTAIKSLRARDYLGDRIRPVDLAVVDTGVFNSNDLELGAGYDALQDKEIPPGVNSDDNGHGTHVATSACAWINNGVNGYGVGNCRIIPIKVLGASGGGSLYHVMKGLEYAITLRRNNPNFRVVNLSLGLSSDSSPFKTIVERAIDAGLILVAAAGNDGSDLAMRSQYPCIYPGVLCVGAIDQAGSIADFSNYGERVDVWAPGVGIYAEIQGNRFVPMDGTSMASPLVAGAIALTGKVPERGILDLEQLAGVRCKSRLCSRCADKCRQKNKLKRRNCRERCNQNNFCEGRCNEID